VNQTVLSEKILFVLIEFRLDGPLHSKWQRLLAGDTLRSRQSLPFCSTG